MTPAQFSRAARWTFLFSLVITVAPLAANDLTVFETDNSDGTTCTPGSSFQEVEPNNSIAAANSLPTIDGAEVRGGITSAGDLDYFSFQTNAGDRIWAYVVTTGAMPSTDSILTLFNSAGATVQLDDDNGFQSSLSSAIAGGVIPATGTYTLQVRQFGGATIMDPYVLYINRTSGSPIVEIEPNDTFATANTYNFGTVAAGSITILTDEDHYKFTVAQNETVIIQVDGDPDRNGMNLSRLNQFNPNLDLLDAAGALITAVDSDSQGGNGGLLSENLRFTNTSTTSTTFAVRIKSDPSTPADDDLGIYNLHIYRVVGIPCLTLTGAVSRKMHAAAGTFDVNLPLSGEPGLECRNTAGNHTLVFTFTNNVVSGNAGVTSGAGLAGAPTFSGRTMTVPLSGVSDVQKITVTLSNVTDQFGQVLPNRPVSMNLLLGDANGNKSVNATDIGQAKGQSGVPVTSVNFRMDCNAGGSINATDISIVKSRSGFSVP